MKGSAREGLSPLDRNEALAIDLEEIVVEDLLGPISLRIGAADRLAVLGRNGAGKSTLLRVVAGLASPYAGVRAVSGRIGWVPQSFRASLLPWLSVRDNVGLALRNPRLSREEIDVRIERALSVIPLSRALLARKPESLSGGEQQLVTLARAIVADPAVLLLDEPFSALDAFARKRLRDTLTAWASSAHATLVIVTHDLDDLALADRVIVIGERPGRIVADVPTKDARRALDLHVEDRA